MNEKIEQDATGRAEIIANGINEPHETGRYYVSIDNALDHDDNMVFVCLECSTPQAPFLVESMVLHDAWHDEQGFR